MKEQIKLTKTDYQAINNDDSNYINNKGAVLYTKDTYYKSVEYYRLASAMGDVQATSNLGYCYLYGRDIEVNLDLAIAYFTIAAKKGNADAAYKLGDIYGSDKWELKDKELSVYYYRMAASFLIDDEWTPYNTYYNDELKRYPSLCFALARELGKDGSMPTDLFLSFIFLNIAKEGYEKELMNGSDMYQDVYEKVLALLDDEQYNEVREDYINLTQEG